MYSPVTPGHVCKVPCQVWLQIFYIVTLDTITLLVYVRETVLTVSNVCLLSINTINPAKDGVPERLIGIGGIQPKSENKICDPKYF